MRLRPLCTCPGVGRRESRAQPRFPNHTEPFLASPLAPPGGARSPRSPLAAASRSAAPQVPAALGISIPCLLFITGTERCLRNTNGSGGGGDGAADPPAPSSALREPREGPTGGQRQPRGPCGGSVTSGTLVSLNHLGALAAPTGKWVLPNLPWHPMSREWDLAKGLGRDSLVPRTTVSPGPPCPHHHPLGPPLLAPS